MYVNPIFFRVGSAHTKHTMGQGVNIKERLRPLFTVQMVLIWAACSGNIHIKGVTNSDAKLLGSVNGLKCLFHKIPLNDFVTAAGC